MLCEDRTSGATALHGLNRDGKIFKLAVNNVGNHTQYEWAGATFSPMQDGTYWVFANIQVPGITFAITGPWKAGPL